MHITYILLLTIITSLPNYNNKSNSSTKSNKKPTTKIQDTKNIINISVLTITNPFFKIITKNITNKTSKHNYKTIMTNNKFDITKQQNQIKNFIVNKITTIALNPYNSHSIKTIIQETNKTNVPIFTFDITYLKKKTKIITHITTNNYNNKKQTNKTIIKTLNNKNNKIIILDFKQTKSYILQINNFKKIITTHNKSHNSKTIKIITELPNNKQKNKNYKTTKDTLQSHPNIHRIFTINNPSTLNARTTLKKTNKTDQIIIINFNNQPKKKQTIKNKKIYTNPIQYPKQITQQTITTIMKYFDNKNIPTKLLIPTKLYQQTNKKQNTTLK